MKQASGIFRHFSIRARLALVIGFLAFQAIVVAALGLRGMSEGNDFANMLANDHLVPVDQIARMRFLQAEARAALERPRQH